ncbi:diacylglycerol kinase [Methylicorpusculum oleiharenae]|uniref:diacylglycerol kinase n=1 Tax=Methylicorpusculum oleiharenae TaxID=1338687 RepID=UPI0022AA29FE|nr:diacylglycerol kinase [Methylicorpusculum oleiharenae]
MRNKFLNTGQSGYHPFRKLKVCLSGLRYAVLYDFSVAYKVILSVLVLAVCFYFRQWVDFISVFAATGLMLICEMFNTTVEAHSAILWKHGKTKKYVSLRILPPRPPE